MTDYTAYWGWAFVAVSVACIAYAHIIANRKK